MKITRKIIWTIAILLITTIGGIVLRLVEYSTSQEYSNVAADQLKEGTDAYKILHTQSGVTELFFWIYLAGAVITLSLIIKVWVTKGVKAKVKEIFSN